MGPILIMAVRHGESAANAAYREALRRDEVLEFPRPDADVPLTDLGRTQAVVGRSVTACRIGQGEKLRRRLVELALRVELFGVCGLLGCAALALSTPWQAIVGVAVLTLAAVGVRALVRLIVRPRRAG